VRLARDLLQVVQETVLRRFDETPKRCPLVKEESDLTSSDEEDGNDKRIANLIDFFFTIVKSQKEERKGSAGSCFRSDMSPTDNKLETYLPTKVNTELEQKMETLIEFLASTGCMDKDEEMICKDDKKITLMEFLFGPEEGKWIEKPIIEIKTEPELNKGISLSESNINVKDLTYIDETPEDDGNETLVDMLIKYMETYSSKDKNFKDKSMSVTPSLSEKSKSDVTISKLETFSDMNKTKSDSTLTQTIDTVIDRGDDRYLSDNTSRRISETVVDLSHVKEDLEDIFIQALYKICEIRNIIRSEDDTMTEQEDIENFNAYTKPPILQYLQYLPYSVELSDIIEEDEPSSRGIDRKYSSDDRTAIAKQLAEDLLHYIERKIQDHFEEDSSSEDSREFDISSGLRRTSISLIDLRNIPDLPPSMIIKPKVLKVDKSTSTTEISDSMSDISKRVESGCMTEDTSLTSSSERNERAMDKIESLHKFFSKSRLEIIDEIIEENGERLKSPKMIYLDSESSNIDNELKAGQASLDDVEDIQDDNDLDKNYNGEKETEETNENLDETDASKRIENVQ
jgi:hypothetical protein